MPMHRSRTWVVHPVESSERLAELLIDRSWCSCQGWSLGGYLLLNDQTSEDGAFEVAVVKPPAEPGGQWVQVESITFGRLRDDHRGTASEQALAYINDCVAGKYDPHAWAIEPLAVETPERHRQRYCSHCA
jgi:hypothetical protein